MGLCESPSADGECGYGRKISDGSGPVRAFGPICGHCENGNWIYLPPGSHGPIFFDYANQEYRNF